MRRHVLTSLLLALFLPFSFCGSTSRSEAPAAISRPKLIVILVIDQFRYDYLVRFRPEFVERGFNLLLSGANFTNCRYDYATTATGPGHACLFTGAYPNLHGIIGNEWYSRDLHRTLYCVEDPSEKPVGMAEGRGASPRNLIGSTLGDELRMASDFRSRVIAISLKDRAAVIPGGHEANAAYWYNAKSGRFVTSTYYLQDLPAWVARFNESSPAKAFCGRNWQTLPETPNARGRVLSEFKPEPNEPCPDEKFLGWLNDTPFMNGIELRFAREAVQNERLGQGPATDMLAVSLSVNDYIGHSFGPYSPQVADTVLRTDRDLAEFFADLDKSVGLENVWVALSADHGVAPNPAFIKEHRLGAGNAQPAAVRSAVEAALNHAFGQGQWIEGGDESSIYLNREALAARGEDLVKAQEVAAVAAQTAPGVQAAYTEIQLLTDQLPRSPLARKASNSFNSQRSGDVFLILEPYAVPVSGQIRTTHGSPWNYDAQVPLVLWGSAFKPGTYAAPCQPIDLTPTLAVALGLTQPSGAQGTPRNDALK